MKKTISILTIISIIIFVLCVLFAGCQNGEKTVADTQDLPQSGESSADNDGSLADIAENDIYNMKIRENAKDDLPEMNFNGAIFTILQRTEWNYEFLAESENGEVVNDAVYKRNLAVEERFNVKLNPIDVMGGWNEQDIYLKKVRNSVEAGDDEFSLLAGYAAYMPKLQIGGHLINLRDLPYVSFDKPWWSKDLMDNITVNNKMFFVTGDLSLSLWEDILAIYFNKKLVTDYQIENPYELVRTGKWTIDKLDEICRSVNKDIDGDGVMTPKDDLFGYATDTTNLVDNFQGCFAAPVVSIGEDGVPYFSMNSQKMADITDKLYEFLWNNPGVYANPISSPGPENIYRYIFEEGRAMFLPELLGNAQALRGMDMDFGIIPYPKWNEAQANYQTRSVAYYSSFCVPVTAQNLEIIGAVTEALCVESYKKVIPAFYEVALKTKYSRDDESAEMIDIIRNGLVFDFGMIYSTEVGGACVVLRNLMSEKKSNFASTFEKNERVYEKALEKLLATFD